MADDFDPGRVTWVLTGADLGHLLAAIAMCDEVVMDHETTGLDPHAVAGGATNGGVAARVVLTSFTLPTSGDGGSPATWVLPLSHPESPWRGQWRGVLGRVTTEIAAARRPLVNQNLAFDLRWMYAATGGPDLSALVEWDTQISSHLLDENASTKLKERAPATFEVDRWDDFDLSTPGAAERVPLIDLGLYAARDTYWTWRLKEAHKRRMYRHPDTVGLEPVGREETEEARLGQLAVWCAMPTVATLTAIEQRGMQLDMHWVHRELIEHQVECGVLIAELAGRYGDDPVRASFAPTSTWFIDWAEKAVAQGDLIIAEMTPTGKPRWSKAVLTRQSRAGHEVAAQLLELRAHSKKAEFLTSWLHWADPTGVIHSVYNAGRVVTGRLSSDSPNMQQVTSALKPAFIPRPGYVFVDFDYGQIELRVGAFVSQCVPMLDALRRGDDLHRLLAARITDKRPEDVDPSERHGGKSANFGLLYGISANGFREYAEDVYGVTYSAEEAIAVRRTFFDTWTGLDEWHAATVERAHRTGQVVSPIGRVRRLPDIWDGSDYLVGAAERAAINAPVQGFASDLMQMAAASIEGNLPGVERVHGALLVGTVHDSILAELPEQHWEEIALECQERMTGISRHLAHLGCLFDVPLTASATAGTRWGMDDVGTL